MSLQIKFWEARGFPHLLYKLKMTFLRILIPGLSFLLSKNVYQVAYCRKSANIYIEWSGKGPVPEFLGEKFITVLRNKTKSFCSLTHVGI